MRLPSKTNGLALLAAAIAFVAYLPSLAAGYVFDDLMLFVANPFAHRLEHVPRCFTTHLWDVGQAGTDRSLHYYRPLVCASYVTNWALGGGKAWTFHLANVLGHALATFLVARVASRWAGHVGLGFLAALVFAVHPSRTENVIWVSGRTDILMVCFGLAAIELAHAAGRHDGPRSHAAIALSAVSMILALLCKEPAVVFGVLCFIDVLANGEAIPNRRAALTAAGSLFGIAALYVLTRIFYPVGGPPLELTPLHALFTIGGYIERVFYPWPQTFYHRPLTHTGGFTEYVLLPVALGVLGLGVLAWLLWRARKNLRLLLLVAAPVVLMLPLLHFVSTGLRFSTSDRFLYLPLPLAVVALAAVFPRACADLLGRRPLQLLGGGILAIWAAIGILRAPDYESSEAFWSRELELAPYNSHALRGLAHARSAQGDVDAAFELVRRSLSNASYRYVLLDIPMDRVGGYALLVSLAAMRAPDGDVATLTHLSRELEAIVENRPEALEGRTAGVELSPRPVKAHLEDLMTTTGPTMYAEAGFLAARLGRREAAARWLARVKVDDFAGLWNVPNYVLAYARLLDFRAARSRLDVAREVLGKKVVTDLKKRIDTAEAWTLRPGSDQERTVFRSIAYAELGAYLLALRELRPAYQRESSPGEATGLFIQLLVSARLEGEALRVAKAAHGEQQGTALVEAMQGALPPRLRSTPPVEGEPAWWALPEGTP